ncbi:MAG TPA: hypothetical protein VD706_01730 [Candidatus Saccharimonadales bacterium]|nr:hypothetical protein [Candidatus Saccharimonadales bacterium]
MIKHNQDGAVNGVVISLVFAVILLLGAIGFGAWAFSSRQDYKENSDTKVNLAVQAAVETNSIKKDKQFAEDAKKPLKIYNGPEALGSVVVNFPKTWSGYVNTAGGNSTGLDAYFNPGVVPPVNDQTSVFALRVQVLNQPYSQVLQSLTSQQEGKITVSAYALPKLPKVVGVKVSGKIQGQQTESTMIVLPLRSQTLQIETEGTQFLADFNTHILPNFSFLP